MSLAFVVLGIIVAAVGLFWCHKIVDNYRSNEQLIQMYRKEIEEDIESLEHDLSGIRDKETKNAKKVIDRDFLESLTKAKISSLAEKLDIPVSVHKRKTEMITDFLTGLDNK